jgi:hypothetical protein
MPSSGKQVAKSKGKKNKLSLRTSTARPLLTQLLTAPSTSYVNGSAAGNVPNGQTNESLYAPCTSALGQENVDPINRISSNESSAEHSRQRKISFPQVRLINLIFYSELFTKMCY